MNWTEPQPPNSLIPYNYVILDTPIGKMVIDWKGWKEHPSYDITLGDEYMEAQFTLEDAKNYAEKYLREIYNRLGKLIEGV